MLSKMRPWTFPDHSVGDEELRREFIKLIFDQQEVGRKGEVRLQGERYGDEA